jgi:chemotaxis protein MotB
MKRLMLIIFIGSSMTSCISKKKYNELMGNNKELKENYEQLKKDVQTCETEMMRLKAELDAKNRELELSKQESVMLKKNNAVMIHQLEDLSIISKTGAESIKKSMEVLNQQSQYIKDLNQRAARKDSLNLALVTNLKRSLADVNDEDVQVEVRGGVVYVSISDKMLFKSGSSEINSAANKVLEKLALIIKDHKDMNVMVEGHTDNVPISSGCVQDNWDLSVKRATAVVRYLETKQGISSERLTAAGRGEYAPKTSNETADGRKSNRRTEIVLTPRIDQYIELSVPK